LEKQGKTSIKHFQRMSKLPLQLISNHRLAWELYLKMDTSGESFALLQLIANDSYKVGFRVNLLTKSYQQSFFIFL